MLNSRIARWACLGLGFLPGFPSAGLAGSRCQQSRVALVARASTGTVSGIEIPGGQVRWTLSVGSGLLDVAVSPDGSTAVASRFLPRELVFLDLTVDPPEVAGTLPVVFHPEDVDISSSGFALVAGGSNSNLVLSIDVNRRRVEDALTLPVGAQAVAVAPDGSLALVASSAEDSIRVVELDPTGGLTDTGLSVPSGTRYPINVEISPDGRIALVTNGSILGGNAVGVLRIDSGTVSLVNVLALDGHELQSIAFARDGSHAYVYESQRAGGPARLRSAVGNRTGRVNVLAIDSAGEVTDSLIRIAGVGPAFRYFGVDQIAVSPDGIGLVHGIGGVTILDLSGNTISRFVHLPGDLSSGGIAVMP